MPLYLYGQSALDLMRYVRVVEGGELPGTPVRPRHLNRAIRSNHGLNELGYDAELMLGHVRKPLHALVPSSNMCARTERLVTHVRTRDVPAGAYLDLGNGICLPTPAFLFLQMATQLDEIGLILLGLELCGYYSLWRYPANKLFPSIDDEFRGCTFELAPASTVAKLRQFIGRRKNERGFSAAQRALRRITDHSASPMETATYLLLSLPRRLGGQGLPAPLLNTEVKVSTSVSTTSRFPDLYWPSHALDVEYQSDQDHSGNWSMYRDARRTVELAAEKVIVLPLTKEQLMDAELFLAFAVSVRRNLGIRARSLDAEWRSRYRSLRKRVLLA